MLCFIATTEYQGFNEARSTIDFCDRRESIHGGSAKTSMFSTVAEIDSAVSLCAMIANDFESANCELNRTENLI